MNITELPCLVCQRDSDMCVCPTCSVCLVAGDPACINTHMPWQAWASALARRAEPNASFTWIRYYGDADAYPQKDGYYATIETNPQSRGAFIRSWRNGRWYGPRDEDVFAFMVPPIADPHDFMRNQNRMNITRGVSRTDEP